ncbi:MAG: DUF4190 domain-containing protein [Thermoplasmatota archaeon]
MEGSGVPNYPGYQPGAGDQSSQPYYGNYNPYGYDPSYYQYGGQGYYGGFNQPFSPPQKFNGLAIASLSCGGGSILLMGIGVMTYYCIFFLGPIALIAALVGLVLGIMAVGQINKDSTYKGKPLAIAGIITSSLTLAGCAFLILLMVLMVLFIFSMPTETIIQPDFLSSVGLF